MDPISALGAASAVIGIAGFAVQLCEVLYKLGSSVKGAHDSLVAVIAIIESTAESLRLIHQYLDLESKNQQAGQKGGLFSRDALLFVKNNADRCLLVFWRIEATVLDKADRNLESTLRDRLAAFDSKARAHPDKLEIHPEPVPISLSFLGHLRWPLVAPKLDEFRSQLQFHQQCLSLVFMVISLGEVRSKPATSNQDGAEMRKMAHEIKAASREIKSIMMTVDSIRGMVEDGDINIGVLFRGHGKGLNPAKNTKPPPACDTNLDSRPPPPAVSPSQLVHPRDPPKPPAKTPASPPIARGDVTVGPDVAQLAPSPRPHGPIAQDSEASTAVKPLNFRLDNRPLPAAEAGHGHNDDATPHGPPKFELDQDLQARPREPIGDGPFAHTQLDVPMGTNSLPQTTEPLGPDDPPVTPKDPPVRVPSMDPTKDQAVTNAESNDNTPPGPGGGGGSDGEEDSNDESTQTSDSDNTDHSNRMELVVCAIAKYRKGLVSRYVIRREGVPVILGPAPLTRLERLAEAVRWWPSKGSICRTLASATQEQLEALAGLLKLPDSNGNSVRRSILRVRQIKEQGGSRTTASADENRVWALLAVVEEDLAVQEQLPYSPNIAEIERKQEDVRAISYLIPDKGRKPPAGTAPWPGGPEVRLQDLSKPTGTRSDFIRKLTTHHVWSIQPLMNASVHPRADTGTHADWSRCLVIEKHLNQDEMIRRPEQPAANSPRGTLVEEWELTIDQRNQISRLEEGLALEEQKGPQGKPKFSWSVEQIKVVKQRSQRGMFEAMRKREAKACETSAILVFCVRRPAEGTDVAELFYTSGHGNERPTYTRMARRHLSSRTLKEFNIDFILDPQDPNYFLIKRWVPEEEQDQLWQHTRTIRNSTHDDNPKEEILIRGNRHRRRRWVDDSYDRAYSLSSITPMSNDSEASSALSQRSSTHRMPRRSLASLAVAALGSASKGNQFVPVKLRKRPAGTSAVRRSSREDDVRRTKEVEAQYKREAEERRLVEEKRLREEKQAREESALAEEVRRRREETRRQWELDDRRQKQEDARRKLEAQEAAERARKEREAHLQEVVSRERERREVERQSGLGDETLRPIVSETAAALNQREKERRAHHARRPARHGAVQNLDRPPRSTITRQAEEDSAEEDSAEEDSAADDDDDIVARLLSEWTPAGAEGVGGRRDSKDSDIL